MTVADRKGTSLAAKRMPAGALRDALQQGSESGRLAFGRAAARLRRPVVGLMNANPYGDLAGVVELRF